MCGIFGHIGSKESSSTCIKGLKFLEYRGYDSAGIAGVYQGNLLCYKEKGKIADLEALLDDKIRCLESTIGHTRWATHGEASSQNAHPHLDSSSTVAVVHNGIIENHNELRELLEKKGIAFATDTDSEVIAQLVAYFYKGSLVNAVRHTARLMKGFWGIALIHKDHPDLIVATCRENPIVVGLSKDETFVSSDPNAFLRTDLDLYFLKNGEIALLKKGSIEVFDASNTPIEKEPEEIELEKMEISKGAYKHFMLKEIFEQPRCIQSTLHNRFFLDLGNADFEHFSPSNEEFAGIQRILILGCGTSWHAGCIATLQIEELAGIPTSCEIASEFRYKHLQVSPETLVIALSQSGETFDLIAAVRKVKKSGAKILAICNVSSSTLMREANYSILLRAGPEISVCSTKAFICQLAILSLVALKFARHHGMDAEQGRKFLEALTHMPHIVEEVLALKPLIDKIAENYAHFSNFLFLGRQYMYYTSLESALKLKEISYLNANGYPAGELKHGPIALIDPSHAVVGLAGNQATYEKLLSNLSEVKARKGHIIAFVPKGSKGIEKIANCYVELPIVADYFASIPYSVASQLLAYSIADIRGSEIDKPRNLAKSVTVE